MVYSLLEFAKLCFKFQKNETYEQRDFHEDISNAILELMSDPHPKNLLITMPPRFGKSDLAIKLFIPWVLAYVPDCKFIIAASSLALAREHMTAIRDTINSEWYRALFPEGAKLKKNIKKRRQKKAEIKTAISRADHFETIQGGAVKAIGLRGLISGFGAGQKRDSFAGCIICDDLLKEQDFASPAKREAVYTQFKSAIMSRKNKATTPIVLIMQRLHPDDIAGRVYREATSDWKKINIKALDEKTGRSVWEKTISTATLLKMRDGNNELDKYLFAAKYQQEPTLELSTILKPSLWQFYDDAGPLMGKFHTRFITMDTAYKAKAASDESVIQLWGVTSDGCAYMLDMIHGRWVFPILLAKSKEFFIKHNKIYRNKWLEDIYIEDKASGTSLVQTLQNEGLPAVGWKPTSSEPKDKYGRVLECSKIISDGKVFLPRNADFTQEFIDQCAAFSPEGITHDDMVDAMTMALMIIRRGL